jgi:hypothetical protein
MAAAQMVGASILADSHAAGKLQGQAAAVLPDGTHAELGWLTYILLADPELASSSVRTRRNLPYGPD